MHRATTSVSPHVTASLTAPHTSRPGASRKAAPVMIPTTFLPTFSSLTSIVTPPAFAVTTSMPCSSTRCSRPSTPGAPTSARALSSHSPSTQVIRCEAPTFSRRLFDPKM
ncbi:MULTISPECIES: hypothetical protein [Actinomadura]|uniref:Uncharacterized protein n=1 Tax=Actinomadura litoris TaxID=2678616 RepID=A0A7K1L9I1_9ACTN|nr:MULTISPECIES: hypothetical protein [Actinomadura]MBT2207240.1 hypothetical protein [Actinomadura sp. NEAU-AAG7]MUN41078.1 hypothetical protein [Actinomadura litoris]